MELWKTLMLPIQLERNQPGVEQWSLAFSGTEDYHDVLDPTFLTFCTEFDQVMTSPEYTAYC
jgi:hypothetical protein